jgi:hypothetical protein
VTDARRLGDLVSVGDATLRDLERLGISTVAELATCEPEELYERIGALDGARHDPCALDVFRAAVAQARDPDLPPDQCRWWWWSRLRKREHAVVARRPSQS